jgi:hypothetical protein
MATQELLERSTQSLSRQPIVRPPGPRRQARTSSEEALADARGREVHARQRLRLAIRRAEQRYALAVQQLEELDLYLHLVDKRLRTAGISFDPIDRVTDGSRDRASHR